MESSSPTGWPREVREVQPARAPAPAWRGLAVVLTALVFGAAAGGGAGGVVGWYTATTLASPRATTAPVTTTTALPDIPAIIGTIRESVVSIQVITVGVGVRGQPTSESAEGTGFVLRSDGMIATNAHVVEDAQSISVTLADGSVVRGSLVAEDPSRDLAVVHVARSGLRPVVLGSSSSLRVGVAVIAIGNALALKGGPTASLGIVSALGRSITTVDGTTYTNLIQTDAAINGGDSGGPLVTAGGEVVGINTAGATTAENIGFAIAMDDARPTLEALMARA